MWNIAQERDCSAVRKVAVYLCTVEPFLGTRWNASCNPRSKPVKSILPLLKLDLRSARECSHCMPSVVMNLRSQERSQADSRTGCTAPALETVRVDRLQTLRLNGIDTGFSWQISLKCTTKLTVALS